MAITKERTIKEILDTDEFELPIGYTDKDGNFHKTVKLQEMTGEVEEAIADPKVRTNMAKVITETVAGVTERLGNAKKMTKDDARKMYNADREFILLMNHKVSLGDTISYTELCDCNAQFDVNVNIDDIPVTYMTQDEPKLLKVSLPRGVKDAEGNVYKEATITLVNGTVQERIYPMLSQNPSQAVTQMMAMLTEDIKGYTHWNIETFRKMGKLDRKAYQNALSEVVVGADLAPMVECPTCGREFKSQIPLTTLLGE